MRMTKRGPGPALYEMLKGHDARSQPPARAVEPERGYEPPIAPTKGEGDPLGWLGPGRTMRVPVGYAILGGAAALIALLLAYIFGYERADTRKQQELDALRSRLVEEDPAHRSAVDPLQGDAGAPGAAADPPSAVATSPRSPGAIESDPRVDGLNYFHLMYTTRERAVEFARFCRGQDLEAYVVRSGKRDGRSVITLPGFTAEARRSAAIQSLETRIKDTMWRWEAKWPREPKLDNPYVAKYKK